MPDDSHTSGHETTARVLDGTPVRTAGSCVLPRRFVATIDDASVPVVVTLTVAVSDAGRASCERLELKGRDGAPVDATMLRQVPLKTLLRTAASAVAEWPAVDGLGGGLASHRRFVRSFDRPVPPRRGRTIPDEHYREVAAVVAEAEAQDRTPVVSVMDRFRYSKSSAYEHMKRAREMFPAD